MRETAKAYPRDQVKRSVSAVIETSDGHLSLWDAQRYVINALDPQASQPTRDRLTAQVYRILDQLAESGELIKFKKGDELPGGSRGIEPHYYTPEAHQKAKDEAARRRLEAENRTARWESVASYLRHRGFTVTTRHPERWGMPDPADGTTGLEITLEDWEKLLGELP
jgi:hypothetical protein